MQREVRQTADGSVTIIVPETGVTYHSLNGAITESVHVFIEAGLKHWLYNSAKTDNCRIFEMGFGTGLNALLTAGEADLHQQLIQYETVENNPLEKGLISHLNYCDQLQRPQCIDTLALLHTCAWEKEIIITPFFTIKKMNTSLVSFSISQPFNIIYYDAFDPIAQPELWTEDIFHKLYDMLSPGGILVTYSSKGAVRRAMQSAGFKVEKLPGAPGKREMIRAVK